MAEVMIQIDVQTARRLEVQAEAHGLSLEDYLRHIAGEGQRENRVPVNGNTNGDAVRDFDAALDELFASDTRKLPAAPLKYARGEIYIDHD